MLRRTIVLSTALVFLLLGCDNSATGEDIISTENDTTVEGEDVVEAREDVVEQVDVPVEVDTNGIQPVEGAITYYRVGVAEMELVPEEPVPMGGFGMGGGGEESVRWSEGVHDAPEVTAFCVQESSTGEFLVFLGVDIVGLMLPDTEEIRARFVARIAEDTGLELPADRIVLSASHAHSTADSVGIWGAFPQHLRDEAYLEVVLDSSARAAALAYENLRDAELTLGRGWLDNSIEGDVMGMDGNMTVLLAKNSDEEVIGSLTIWSAHPTCYGSGNNALSADFVGTFRARMKDESGGGVHTFLQGPIGNVYANRSEAAAPRFPNPFTDGYMDPDVSQDSHDMVAGVGYVVAAEALTSIDAGNALAEAPLRTKRFLYEATVTNLAYKALASMGVVPREMYTCGANSCTEAEAQWFTLGGLHGATMAGEAFPHYADAVRAKLVEHGAVEGDTVVIGLGNDWLGYLLVPEEYAMEEFDYHRGLSPSYTWLEEHMAALDELLQ